MCFTHDEWVAGIWIFQPFISYMEGFDIILTTYGFPRETNLQGMSYASGSCFQKCGANLKAGKNAVSETTEPLLCRGVSVVSYFISEEAHLRILGDVRVCQRDVG